MRLLITLTIALLFVSLKLSAQITTQKMFEPSNDLEETPYDSTLNFLGENVNQYIGELLYVKGMSESLRYYGYDGFVKDYREFVDNPSNVYECCDRYNSKYKKLVERSIFIFKLF